MINSLTGTKTPDQLSIVPNLMIQGKGVSIMKIRKAIIPAAGLGTRLLPATKSLPKEMLPIVDRPAIQYIIEEAVASGIEEILIITGRNKRAIEDHFDKSIELEMQLKLKNETSLLNVINSVSNLADIYYIRQKEPKGLGHAILCAKSFVGYEPFAVMLGDDIIDCSVPCLKQLIAAYDKYNSSVIGVQEVSPNNVNKFGIINGIPIESNIYKVTDLVEKPSTDKAPSNIAILGRYIITPEIFNILEHTIPGVSGEIQLTDALKELVLSHNIYALLFNGKRYDIGDKLGFIKANIEIALKHDDLGNELIEYLKTLK